MNNQLKLGIFAVVGVLAIIASIFAVGSFSLQKTYCIYVSFNNIAGLSRKAKVKMAGVNIGILKDVSLENSKAKLKLSIDKKIVLYEGSQARIVSIGIIGTKYIEIVPGNPLAQILKSGDSIPSIESSSLENTLTNIVDKINGALDSQKNGNMMENLAEAVCSLRSFLEGFASQGGQISEMISNLNKFSANIASISANNRQNLQDTILMIKNVASKLNTLVDRMCDGDGTISTLANDKQMSQDLKETVASAKGAFKSLNDTIGKANKLKFSWNCTGRYNSRTEKFSTDVGITLMPNDSKFYHIGVSNISDNSDSERNKDEKKSINKLEALIGFRSKQSEVYLGAMRGKGGIGFGYSFLQPMCASYKTLKANLDVYDFTRKTRGPVVNAGIKFGITKWLYVGVAVEDTTYTPAVTPYLNISLDDRDLVSLLGIIGIAATASK
ncbi:MAG: MlaD family protein [Endomicrobium sp.]|jgi:phospholipid/cholesterol/gamma-HCH transport system substrate-binding protein|nr:MlaD family protein [Endomicrobium sp.]